MGVLQNGGGTHLIVEKTYIIHKKPEIPFKYRGCRQCMFVENIHKPTFDHECRFMLIEGGLLLIISCGHSNGRN